MVVACLNLSVFGNRTQPLPRTRLRRLTLTLSSLLSTVWHELYVLLGIVQFLAVVPTLPNRLLIIARLRIKMLTRLVSGLKSFSDLAPLSWSTVGKIECLLPATRGLSLVSVPPKSLRIPVNLGRWLLRIWQIPLMRVRSSGTLLYTHVRRALTTLRVRLVRRVDPAGLLVSMVGRLSVPSILLRLRLVLVAVLDREWRLP